VSTKEVSLDMIRRPPDDATWAEIMAELWFRQKVDHGLSELDAGKGVPHEQARERLPKWFK
jgi:predicted transcriptional regulator